MDDTSEPRKCQSINVRPGRLGSALTIVTPISTESGVVGSDAAGLHPQSETDQPAIVDLEGLFRGLGHFAREQVRSNDGAHGEISSSGSRVVDAWGVEAPSQFFEA